MAAKVTTRLSERPTTPGAALTALRHGNERFVGGAALHPNQDAAHRAALADAQSPFAVIFGCSDSRLAAEIIFDQGLGDLFVVRTVGHTVGAEVLGSIEYAVTVLRTPLVVVLGHSSCGAVATALDAATGRAQPSGFVATVVKAVTPSIERARARGIGDVDGFAKVHVEQTVAQLQEQSEVLAAAVNAGSCAVVGMSYRLADGGATLIGSLGNRTP